MRNWILTLPWILAGTPAWAAGGHYPVDDTELVEPGVLSLESWAQWQDSDTWELAAVSAVTVGDEVEVALGVYRLENEGDRQTRFEPAVKFRLPWSARDGTVTTAMSFMAGVNDGSLEDLLWNLPVSGVVSDDLVVLVNAGWLREKDSGDWSNRLYLGAGFERNLTDSLGLIGQVYREGRDEEAGAQLGLRLAGSGPVDAVDFAVGRPLSGQDKDWFFTVGAAFTF